MSTDFPGEAENRAARFAAGGPVFRATVRSAAPRPCFLRLRQGDFIFLPQQLSLGSLEEQVKKRVIQSGLLALLLSGCATEDNAPPSEVSVKISGPDTAYLFFPETFTAQVQSDAAVYRIAWDFNADGKVDTLGSALSLEQSFGSTFEIRGEYGNNASGYVYTCEARVRVVTEDRGVAFDTLRLPCIHPVERFPQAPPVPLQNNAGQLFFTPSRIWPNASAHITSKLKTGVVFLAGSLQRILDTSSIEPDTVLGWKDTLRLAPDTLQSIYVRVENWTTYSSAYARYTYKLIDKKWYAVYQEYNPIWLAHPLKIALADSSTACPGDFVAANFSQLTSSYPYASIVREWLAQGAMDSSDVLYTPQSFSDNQCLSVLDDPLGKVYTNTDQSRFVPCADTAWLFCAQEIQDLPGILL